MIQTAAIPNIPSLTGGHLTQLQTNIKLKYLPAVVLLDDSFLLVLTIEAVGPHMRKPLQFQKGMQQRCHAHLVCFKATCHMQAESRQPSLFWYPTKTHIDICMHCQAKASSVGCIFHDSFKKWPSPIAGASNTDMFGDLGNSVVTALLDTPDAAIEHQQPSIKVPPLRNSPKFQHVIYILITWQRMNQQLMAQKTPCQLQVKATHS